MRFIGGEQDWVAPPMQEGHLVAVADLTGEEYQEREYRAVSTMGRCLRPLQSSCFPHPPSRPTRTCPHTRPTRPATALLTLASAGPSSPTRTKPRHMRAGIVTGRLSTTCSLSKRSSPHELRIHVRQTPTAHTRARNAHTHRTLLPCHLHLPP